MENPGIDNENVVRSVKERIVAVLENPSEKQKEIVNKLPDDLVGQARQMLEDMKKYQHEYGFGNQTEGREMIFAAGWLFEQIAGIEMAETGKVETDLGRELRGVLNDPRKYLKRGGYPVRNPDLAMVDEQTGEVKGWVECKLGKLDRRSMDQLGEDGFELSFRKEIDFLKGLGKDFLNKCGLVHIGQALDSLSVAEKVEKWLYISKKDPGEMAVSKEVVMAVGGTEKVKEIIGKYRLKQSEFSKNDVYKMAQEMLR